MMRPEIITGTFQTALDAPPLLCSHEPEHVSTRREQRYIPLLMTQESDCWFYGALQQLQMLLHVRWSKQDEYLSHQQPGAVSYHLCAAVLHKGMGAL